MYRRLVLLVSVFVLLFSIVSGTAFMGRKIDEKDN